MVRPFRRSDLIRVIEAAHLDSTTAAGRVAAQLEAAFRDRPDEAWFRIEPRVGAEGYSWARRDPLHPAGPDQITPYAEATIEGRAGNLVIVSRPVVENRLKSDPDWTGASLQQKKNLAYRFVDAYGSAQFKWARIFYGQMDRNWGPVGTPGLSVSNAGYPRTALGFDVMLKRVQLEIIASELNSDTTASGTRVNRYFLAHRLNVQVTDRLNLAIWETGILAGPNTTFEPSFGNPFAIASFPLQFGEQDDRNTAIGGDFHWRPTRRLLLEAQGIIDDRWRHRADPDGTGESSHPGRWAFTLAGSGALGRALSWRTSFTTVSSLAYRTTDSTQSFTDRDIGIGPQFDDYWQLAVSLGVPVARQWLIRPDAALLRQGEGRIDAPFPTGAELSSTPELFIGTVATTYRLGVSVFGRFRGFELQGSTGIHHTTNDGHVAGVTKNRLEAHLKATIGWSFGGRLQ
jgi:hypothetical protein